MADRQAQVVVRLPVAATEICLSIGLHTPLLIFKQLLAEHPQLGGIAARAPQALAAAGWG